MQKVLFSLVGFSDPIRNNYDGPMLHLVRHLKPEKVYIFMTKEIEDRDTVDNRYEKAIHSIDSSIIVEKITTNISDPHLHDASSEVLKDTYSTICEKHVDDEVYINISSGTPQLITVLNLLIVTYPQRVFPYQVTTPEKRGNTSTTTHGDYEIDLEIEMNLDADESEATSQRLLPANLLQYRRSMVAKQIIALIEQQFDYEGALTILKSSGLHATTTIYNLLNHGALRLKLQTDEAKKRIRQIDKVHVYPFHPQGAFQEMIEYYQIIKVQQKTDRLSNTVLMLEPFSVRLQELYMKHILKINVEAFKNKEGKGPKKLMHDKLKEKDSSLLEKLDAAYNGFGDHIPNVENYHIMVNHFMQKMSKHNDSFLTLSEYLAGLKKLRNKLAHELRTTTDSEINKTIGITSKLLLSKIESVLTSEFSLSKKQLSVYENLNTEIIALMKQIT